MKKPEDAWDIFATLGLVLEILCALSLLDTLQVGWAFLAATFSFMELMLLPRHEKVQNLAFIVLFTLMSFKLAWTVAVVYVVTLTIMCVIGWICLSGAWLVALVWVGCYLVDF